MELRDLGEFGLIARIERAAARLPRPRGVVVSIGDDAAVLRPRRGEDVVVTTDSLVEDVHFRWRSQSPRTVGRRALAVSLSDLAAMGARPLGFTLALVAPPALAVSTVDGLVAGLLQEARTHACPLVGGNVSAGGETSLGICAIGAVERGRALRRRGARAGDRILVTGALGAAALELARAERGQRRVRRVPMPRLRAGRVLARIPGVGACIDVSDGLEADLSHLLEGTDLVAAVDPARIPLPPRFRATCEGLAVDPECLARAGGEDYELLFTLRPAGPDAAVLSRRLGVRVTEIGLVARAGGRRCRPPDSPGGWTHF